MAAEALRFGFHTGGNLERAVALEAAGVDSLWAAGHIAAPNPTGEAMTGLARLSAVTSRVAIGTSILLLPLYPPVVVAKQVAELDRATGGRVVLGVGVGGEYPAEFSAAQVPVAERGRRTNEAIGLLRRLWTEESVTHAGPFYPMEGARIQPAPAQPGGPPIVVAGRQEVAMRRAALLGDGWMPYLYSPHRYAASVATVRRVAQSASRDLSDFGWYAYMFVNVDPDGDEARAAAARSLGGNYRQDFRAMIDSVAVAGTPAEVTAKLRAFVDAGARHFIVTPAPGPGGDPQPTIDHLLGDIVPALRQEYAGVAAAAGA